MNSIFIPSLLPRGTGPGVALVSILRAVFMVALILAIDWMLDTGSAPIVLCISAVLGVLICGYLAFTRLNHAGLLVVGALTYLVGRAVPKLLGYLRGSSTAENVLAPYILRLHWDTIFIVFALAGISTWLFWKFRHTLTVEVLALSGACVLLLAGHRKFQFDSPELINSLAWTLGIENLRMLVGIAVGITTFILVYLYAATLPGATLARARRRPISAHHERRGILQLAVILSGLVALVWFVAVSVYGHYQKEAEDRAANGVGQATQEGMSPLGFHSALGTSNQPAALVRFEGDYPENPFTPMLYMRESALSEFNGHDLVVASAQYDRDLSRTSPYEAFQGEEDTDLASRVPITQSVFLLGEQKSAFTIDYPISISRLKITQARFKAAYRAYSIAPGFSLKTLAQHQIGDPRWSAETLAHYTKPHPDPRYSELAHRITQDAQTPLDKVQAVVGYLSDNAIYTLAPGHEEKPGEDPVAPFLFGDMRGYCVHFAHATVYLLRALGIPARIGTGYLTDLSEAKDGHILLRMSDRHAWAEVYLEGLGWIPFDTKPKQVESHAESPVDMQTLEELMALLDPGEEILPKDVAKDEPNLTAPTQFELPEARYIYLPILGLLFSLLLIKFYLLFSWILPASNETKLRRSYNAIAARLYDLGIRRLPGETREEFRTRVLTEKNLKTLSLTPELNLLRYAGGRSVTPLSSELSTQRERDLANLASLVWWKKLLGWLNPASVFAVLGGKRW